MEVFASKAVGIAQEEFTVKTLEMLNDISEMQDCKSKSTIDAGQKTLDSTTKNISMVGDAVEKSKSLLESYSSKQKENTSTMISQSNQICETADTVLLQIKSTTDSCQQEVATAFDSLKSKLNKARERMLESLTGQQEEMISSLTQAITESVNNQKVVVESFFSEMTGEVDASFEQTNGTLDSVEKTAEVGKDQLLSMQEQHTKELKICKGLGCELCKNLEGTCTADEESELTRRNTEWKAMEDRYNDEMADMHEFLEDIADTLAAPPFQALHRDVLDKQATLARGDRLLRGAEAEHGSVVAG
jgi:hypothetical protein